jgi:hypothetical protein
MRFGIARLPEASPLPLILRDLGKFRWQLFDEATPFAALRGRGSPRCVEEGAMAADGPEPNPVDAAQ